MKLAYRLSRLEREARVQKGTPSDVKLFWHDELRPCTIHSRCDVENATGEHHSDVIHLSFGAGQE